MLEFCYSNVGYICPVIFPVTGTAQRALSKKCLLDYIQEIITAFFEFHSLTMVFLSILKIIFLPEDNFQL